MSFKKNSRNKEFFQSIYPYDISHKFKWELSIIPYSTSKNKPEFNLSSNLYPYNITFSNFDFLNLKLI